MSARRSLYSVRLVAGIVTVLFGAAFAVPATAGATAQNGQPAVAVTPLPVRDGSAHDLGPYSPSQTIRLAIGLRPPHMAAEQQFLRELQDKSSPLFHQFLTTAAWTARFGPSAARAAGGRLMGQGAWLDRDPPLPEPPGRGRGRAASAPSRRRWASRSTTTGSARRTFFANDHDPVVPHAAARAIVESVDGLSNLQTMFPASPRAQRAGEPGVRGRSRRRRRPARGRQWQPRQAARGAEGTPQRGAGPKHHRRRLRPDGHLQLAGLRLQRALRSGPLL